MARVAKYTRSQVGGLTRHFERAKDKITGDYLKFGNQNIDITKTNMNYNLAENKNQIDFIKNRCNEVKCLNRKDVNVICGCVVTLPKGLTSFEDEKKFFKETYKFLNNRYGEQNVISAYVHKDETTPHMHYAFVPVAKEKTKILKKHRQNKY